MPVVSNHRMILGRAIRERRHQAGLSQEKLAEKADPNRLWTQFYVGTKSSCTASGLNPGQMHYFRVKAVGPLGPGPWSDIAQKRAS